MKQLLIEALRTYGERTAYISGGDSVTYSELRVQAEKLVQRLSETGTGPVGIYGHKQAGMFVALVACILSNRAYIPLDSSLPKERIDNIISQGGVSLVLNVEEKTETVIQNNRERTDSTAYIIFTSGSTGSPKGIPISYENLKNFCEWEFGLEGFRDAEREVVFNQANFNFDLSVAALFFSLLKGYTIVNPRKEELNDYSCIFEEIKRENVSFMVLTPSFLNFLLLEPEFDAEHYPKIKCIYLCGETLSKNIAGKALKRFPDITLLNAYGPTEATSAVCAVKVTKDLLAKYASIPVGTVSGAACDIRIENGEIVLCGKSVSKGYIGDRRGGFSDSDGGMIFRTGDNGFIQDGFLFFAGRRDFQVKYKGYRIETE